MLSVGDVTKELEEELAETARCDNGGKGTGGLRQWFR